MADVNRPPNAPVAASAQFLRDAEIRRGIELLYFGYTNMVKAADIHLAGQGLGRAHHRALYFIARRPGMPIGDLLDLLNITKQSLSRVLGDLQARDLVVQAVGTRDRRQRMLHLTSAGEVLETALFDCLKGGVTRAYGHAGQAAVTGFWTVLAGLIPPTDRPLIEALQQEAPGEAATA
jgi:DNA-binding MarR family transcriptional regulator